MPRPCAPLAAGFVAAVFLGAAAAEDPQIAALPGLGVEGACEIPRAASATDDPDSTASRVLLTDAAHSDGAVCLDGTPAAYYLRPGAGSGTKKWYIHHQGGGWCTNLDSCVARSKTQLGSSKGYPDTIILDSGYFSQDPIVNPMMYNWNVVHLNYCDGGSFSGNSATTTSHRGSSLHFRGKAVLNAMQQDLIAAGLGDATDVVISGCSAGGLATYLHVDQWADLLSKAKVVGLPDSGFFLDYEGQGGFHSQLRWVFEQMNASAGVNQRCVEAHAAAGEAWKCMFAEYTSPFIKTPTFALQSTYDSWQLQNELVSQDAAAINDYGKQVADRVKESFLDSNSSSNGVFLDSCAHHCGGWGTYYVGGENQSTAFQEWYEKGSAALPNKGYYAQAQPYPCKACCQPPAPQEEEGPAAAEKGTANVALVV